MFLTIADSWAKVTQDIADQFSCDAFGGVAYDEITSLGQQKPVSHWSNCQVSLTVNSATPSNNPTFSFYHQAELKMPGIHLNARNVGGKTLSGATTKVFIWRARVKTYKWIFMSVRFVSSFPDINIFVWFPLGIDRLLDFTTPLCPRRTFWLIHTLSGLLWIQTFVGSFDPISLLTSLLGYCWGNCWLGQ